MAYIVSIDPSIWTSPSLSGKFPQMERSSITVELQGNNAWGTSQQLIIDAGGDFDALTVTMLSVRGQEKDAPALTWSRTQATPTSGSPYVTLNANWYENKTMSVSCVALGDIILVEGVDWGKNKANNRIDIINTSLLSKQVTVGYWVQNVTYTYTDRLEVTVRNLINLINRTPNIGVLAIADKTNPYKFTINSIAISENSDSIEVSRANVSAGEILIAGQDVDGPLTLSGFVSNKILVPIKATEKGEWYIEGIPGPAISMQKGKEFAKEKFEALDPITKADIALYVTKGILQVYDTETETVLTATEVLHSGYIDVKVVPEPEPV